MGGVSSVVSRRLAKLEEDAQDRAAAEMRRVWANLTDWEIALMLAPYADGIREPTPEEREMEKNSRAAMPEELITRAAGLTEHMGPEERDRRVSNLVGTFGISERRDRIRRHMLASGGGDER